MLRYAMINATTSSLPRLRSAAVCSSYSRSLIMRQNSSLAKEVLEESELRPTSNVTSTRVSYKTNAGVLHIRKVQSTEMNERISTMDANEKQKLALKHLREQSQQTKPTVPAARSSGAPWRLRLETYTNPVEPGTEGSTSTSGSTIGTTLPPSEPSKWRRSLSGRTAEVPKPTPIQDMRDVSLLRAAYLKCAERTQQQQQQQQESTPRPFTPKDVGLLNRDNNNQNNPRVATWRSATTRFPQNNQVDAQSNQELPMPLQNLHHQRTHMDQPNQQPWIGSSGSRLEDSRQNSPIVGVGSARQFRATQRNAQWRNQNQEERRVNRDQSQHADTYRSQHSDERHSHHQNGFRKVDHAAVFFTDRESVEAEKKKRQERLRERERLRELEREANDRKVTLPPSPTSVAALSSIFRVKIDRIMRKLRDCGEKPTDEEYIVDIDTMELVALDLGLEPIRSNRRIVTSVLDENRSLLLQRRSDDAADTYSMNDSNSTATSKGHSSLPLRPPVVCLMGHVDHGKTTLMDALRRKKSAIDATGGGKKKKKAKNKADEITKTTSDSVAGTEAGGITQVISAFQVALENEDGKGAVTFLDTPGHAAFRAMRESGSHAADVIVLVVAADDGVSKQTIEIIDFFKSIFQETGGISMVVAMTKIDKPGIIVDESRYRIENELLEHGIVTESFASTTTGEYGPPVQLVPVSGKTGDGVDELIEALVLQSEVMELRADPGAQAEGIVLDARIEKGVGVVADCVIRWGSIQCGDVILSGVHIGKVKALKNVNGQILKVGSPSQPVKIIGFRTLPKAGDPIVCVESEEKADQLVERRNALGSPDQNQRVDDDGPSTLQVMGVNAQHRKLQAIHEKYNIEMDGEATTLRIPVLLKADADGTLAALREAVVAIGDESRLDLIIDPIALGVGAVTTSDVTMAKDSNAVIFSFNVKQYDKEAMALVESLGVTMKSNNVIYSILDAAKEVFATYLPPTMVTHVHGEAIVQVVFEITNKDKERERVAGLRVVQGKLFSEKTSVKGTSVDCLYRVFRNGEQISPEDATITAASLRRVKEDVEEVRNGEECGLGLSGFQAFEEGDIIECYSIESKAVFV